MPHLGEGDVRFEPAGALVSGIDGLDALRAIIGSAPAYLPTGGWLVVEHGFDQSEAVRALFAARRVLRASKAIATCVGFPVSLPAGATEIRQPSVRASGRHCRHSQGTGCE